ncbi:uncharacterized protein LOC111928701 isoform X2 [Cyanistes caeruleus]|uniref:uncharacterized protein LOC111928701 isoform X2 n=1 Tax=Cyanistes caeruleus TaxID=156563 RepID=UPI000CDA9D95|nr:uncharacterized protein LOC111928701 isoform X2 [Cyanistes caeruleus]
MTRRGGSGSGRGPEPGASISATAACPGDSGVRRLVRAALTGPQAPGRARLERPFCEGFYSSTEAYEQAAEQADLRAHGKRQSSTPAPTPGHSLSGRLQLEATRPPVRIFQAGTDSSEVHSISKKSELPSLYCRLHILAATWISVRNTHQRSLWDVMSVTALPRQ